MTIPSQFIYSNPIKIAGAGIAGMTAAINIKRSGKHVILYEKQAEVGESRHGDYEGLENWIFQQSMDEFFQQAGLEFSKIQALPVSRICVHSGMKNPLWIQSQRPFFYMVRRGTYEDCLDRQFYELCKKEKVEFRLNTKAPSDIDIISTGSQKAAAFIQGINFETNKENQVHLLLGDQFAPKGYAYLIIINGRGTLATAYKINRNQKIDPFTSTKNYFTSKGFIFSNETVFASRGSFALPVEKKEQKPIIIGEAGGYQDNLFGFGMRMAMMSGKAAAYSILGYARKSKSVLKELNKKRKLSYINRILYERLNDVQKTIIAEKILNSAEPVSILSKAYHWNIKNIQRLYDYGDRYEIRTA